jgi:hypothetical protein
MKEWLYKMLPDLPPPPETFLKNIDHFFRPEQQKFSPQNDLFLGVKSKEDWRNQEYEWIQPMASNKNKRHRFNETFTNWIAENITPEFQHKNSGVMFFDEMQLPHTDLTRDFVLLYNLKNGGDKAKICFWQEENKEVYRERMLALNRGSHLKLLDEMQSHENCWYLINARVLHSVENVSDLRVNLQISFENDLPKSILDRM